MATTSKRGNSNDEGVVALIFLLFFSSFFYFFKNANLVFLIFEAVTLIFFIIIVLNSMYHIWNEDNDLALENAFIAIPLLFLFLLGYLYIDNIPRDLISILREQNFGSFVFNNKLNDYGKNLSFDMFIASVLLLITLIYNAYHVLQKLLHRYIFEKSNSIYIFIVVNVLLLGLSIFTFSIGMFR